MDDGVITTVDPQASADEGVARHIAASDPCAHSVLRSLARAHRSHPDFDPAWLED